MNSTTPVKIAVEPYMGRYNARVVGGPARAIGHERIGVTPEEATQAVLLALNARFGTLFSESSVIQVPNEVGEDCFTARVNGQGELEMSKRVFYLDQPKELFLSRAETIALRDLLNARLSEEA